MSSLADHYDEAKTGGGNKWLMEGQHNIVVESFKLGNSSVKGTPYVEFNLVAEGGGAREATFYLTQKAGRMLASFAIACGMTKQEMLAYDYMGNPQSHQLLVGKACQVFIDLEKNERTGKTYKKVKEWAPLGAKTDWRPSWTEDEPAAGEFMPAATDNEVPF